ncbi:MAG: hypothetical protein IOD12_00545, partial [Silvanigrellales bacterium]|nr:hypothetical protein [Silvanigrellales bacterium]
MTPHVRAALALGLLLGTNTAFADQFHYSNVLLGARAQGLGGAFAGLSDDASGVAYNPGGTAFARGDDLSLSATTFYQRRTAYQKALGGEDFQERARGAVSSFLGGLTRLGGKAPLTGITFGFALSTPDAGLIDENSTLVDIPSATLKRYHRTQSTRATTLHAAASAAFGIGSSFGLGFSGGYFDIDEVTVIYQDVLQGPYTFASLRSRPVYALSTINTRTTLGVGGVEAGMGARYVPFEAVSLGLSFRARRLVRQRYGSDRDALEAWVDADNTPVRADTPQGTEEDPRFNGTLKRRSTSASRGDAFQGWPAEVRAGIAVSLGKQKVLTWAADVVHHTQGHSTEPGLSRSAVTNLASGVESVWFSRLVLRAGAFTNFDATASRDPLSDVSRGEHVDMLGATGGLAIRVKASEYGAVY